MKWPSVIMAEIIQKGKKLDHIIFLLSSSNCCLEEQNEFYIAILK